MARNLFYPLSSLKLVACNKLHYSKCMGKISWGMSTARIKYSKVHLSYTEKWYPHFAFSHSKEIEIFQSIQVYFFGRQGLKNIMERDYCITTWKKMILFKAQRLNFRQKNARSFASSNKNILFKQNKFQFKS